ncbi:MAG: hypothetical protein DWG76_07225 [Chloroflexi bacterium]|nr:hypothetical protein [Chloroflexota bacterium]
MANRRILLIIGGVLGAGLICIACFAVVGVGSFFVAREIDNSGLVDGVTQDSGPTPEVVRTQELTSDETLRTLMESIVPENNPVELAERLLGVADIPDTIAPREVPYQVGDRRSFWVTNTETEQNFQTEAVLRYVGEIVYFWVEDGVSYDQADLVALAQTFENEIVPINRAFFGSEWSPGIDGDPHIYILYSTDVGGNTAGYFSSADEIHPLAHEFSNAAEMFLLNADNSYLDEEYTYGVFAHEFQHMIHWYRDRNETSWLNEGLSELATLLNGYIHTGFAQVYTASPDVQLNDWSPDPNANTPHYGAGLLFTAYFLDQFGAEATQALVGDEANGLDSVDDVMEQFGYTRLDSGEVMTADDVVLNWMVANYLLDGSLDAGQYGYPEYSDIVTKPRPSEYVSGCAPGQQARDVHQYGADYIRIDCEGPVRLLFEGSSQVQLVPSEPYSGDYAFWSNKGDESDMRLTQAFDFTDVSGSLTLSYWTWFDIEADWDYAYVLASTNGGDSWDFLGTPSSTETDPNGNSYGLAYSGFSGGGEDAGIWIQESIDLSDYAGQNVLLRFEYITDAAVNGEGMLLDDIEIAEIGYFSDFESDSGGWDAEGWARIQNVLPQTFGLALIRHGVSDEVQILEVPATNDLEIQLDFGDGVDGYTLIVTGTTRFTRQSAGYRFDFLP